MEHENNKTYDDVLNEIALLKNGYEGGFLLVEGVDDVAFWDKQLLSESENNCVKLISLGSKNNAPMVTKELDDENEKRTLGVIDADFDHVFNRELSSDRLVRTDVTDLETMLLTSNAWKCVINQMKDEELASLQAKYGENLLGTVLQYGAVFGKIRYINECRRLGFKIKGIRENYCKFSKKDSYKGKKKISIPAILDFEELRNKLITDFCARTKLSQSEILTQLEGISVDNVAKIVRGKDLVAIIVLLFGEVNHEVKTAKNLIDRLNLAFHKEDLCQTTMFQTLKRKADAWNLNMLPDCS